MLRSGMLVRGPEHERTARGYRRLIELGRGGMSRVHLAERVALGVRKLVVLKVLNPELAVDPDLRGAFRREAELSARLNHPNVVQVLEVFESALAPVIVMEHLDGVSLAAVLKHWRAEFPLPLSLHVLCQVLAGIHYLHELRDVDGSRLNAVHRDVSPQNVMVLYDGAVKVLDLGIAKVGASNDQATQTGVVKGKIYYMPPEQLLGERDLDLRADIFAVGVMLWEALSGRRMWFGKSDQEIMRALAMSEIPELGEVAHEIPAELRRITERATRPKREERYQSALDMQIELEAVLEERRWLVQPRVLADFLRARFAGHRARQQAHLKEALMTPSDGDVLSDDPGDRALDGADLQHPGPSSLRSSRRSLLPAALGRWGFVGGGGLIIAAIWMVFGWTRAREAPATSPQMVVLEVEVAPPNAEIFLDGASIGRGRFRGAEPAREKKRVLEVRAAGHVAERRELLLKQNSSLQFVLEPLPAAASTQAASAAAVVPPAHARVGSRDRAEAGGPRRIAKRSSNCNPPYVFGSDGVKTFKPECY